MVAPLPVTLIGGFLGAGKTTLLNRLLTSVRGRRVAVLVNDFGSLDIDVALVESVHEGVIGLRGGCMCCAIRGSAVSTVVQLAESPSPPDHAVIEASGVSDLAALGQTFQQASRHAPLALDGLIAVVDALAFAPNDPHTGLLLRCQVMAADLVVLNKIDLVDDERQQTVTDEIRASNATARIVPAIQSDVPVDVLLGLHTESVHAAAVFPTAAAAFDSRAITFERALDGRRLVAALTSLPADVYRAKGFVRLANRAEDRVLMQVVGRRVDVRTVGTFEADEPGRVVLIAKRGDVDWDAIEAALRAAEIV